MRIVLMRHGATEGNECRRYVGRRTDEPLSAAGRAQCLEAGVHPELRLAYVSGMLRARQSAEICFPQAELRVVPGLEEFDFGDFEGKSAQDLERDEAYRAWVDSGCKAPCPGGDEREAYCARVAQAMRTLMRDVAQRGERDLVVVAHGGTVMATLSSFADARREGVNGYDDYFCWQLRPAEGYAAQVRFDGGVPRIEDVERFVRLPL